jgi:hypothetical protein
VTNDPIEFISQAVPGLFNAGAAEMKAAAEAGDADAKKRHEDLLRTTRAVRVVLEGKGGADVYLLIKGARCAGRRLRPASR